MSKLSREKILAINQKGWDVVAPKFHGGTALPEYGPLAQTEASLHLLDDLAGKAALELGCGSGHSLLYLAKKKGAAELWGLDLSPQQIRFSRETLRKENISAHLLQASMDENPGIPLEHFDLVFSVYGLGWTPDLDRTLALVYSYLKPGGALIFSGEHPTQKCLRYDKVVSGYVFDHSYFDEGPQHDFNWKGVEIFLYTRCFSTYLNALAGSGLLLEKVIEPELNMDLAREKDNDPAKWYSVPRARLQPTTFIIKARKPG
jgi:SAM-dependent methyltransferase